MMTEKVSLLKSNTTAIVTPLSLTFCLIGIIVGIIIAWVTRTNELYQYVVVLPFAFSSASFFSGYVYKNVLRSPVSFFILSGYFARMVIQPFLFCLGGYISFYTNVVSDTNLLKAILLLSLENIVVFFIANKYNRSFVYTKSYVVPNMQSDSHKERTINLLLLLLLGFLFFAYNYVPELQSIYILLPTADFSELANIRWDNEMLVARGSGARYIYSLFMFCWPIVRAILPAFCIFQVYKLFGKSRKAVGLSLFCLLIPSLFLGGDNIEPFMGAVFGILVIHRLFGNKAKKAIVVACTIFFIVFCIVLFSKILLFQNWRGAQGLASVSQIVNAYLPGFDNIAVAYSIHDPNKLNTFFYDIYYVIPFKETIFGLRGDDLINLYTYASSTGAQIVPWGYQLAHYFTLIGSVFLTAVFISLAYKNEIKTKLTDSFWDYYKTMYFSVLIPISISIYSFSIFLRICVCVFLPIIFITYICHK